MGGRTDKLSCSGPILPNEATHAGKLRNIGRDQSRSATLGGDQQIIRTDRSSSRL